MGAKSIDELVLQVASDSGRWRLEDVQSLRLLVERLRAAGLLLEAGQRREWAVYLHRSTEWQVNGIPCWCPPLGKHNEGNDRCVRLRTLLRELAGKGEPGHVGAPSSQERATGEDRAGGTVGTSSQPSSRPHEPAPVVDEPAPPASAPRRMVAVNMHDAQKLKANSEHNERPECLEAGCRPVEPPTPRRMRGDVLKFDHESEHDVDETCSMVPACQPVASSSPVVHRVEHPDKGLRPDGTCAYRDCQPSATEAAGPLPSGSEPYCILCGRTARAGHAPNCGKPTATQPPHVHQWAAVEWLRGERTHLGDTIYEAREIRVTREHCVADGCSSPPATREVQHG